MKHLLIGSAIAAALTYIAPAWAQAPTMPSDAAASTSEPSAQSGAPAAASRKHARRVRHPSAAHQASGRTGRSARRAGSSPADNMADQLNRQELQKSPSASSMPPAGVSAQGAPPQSAPPPRQNPH
jgi:hypothetical protein